MDTVSIDTNVRMIAKSVLKRACCMTRLQFLKRVCKFDPSGGRRHCLGIMIRVYFNCGGVSRTRRIFSRIAAQSALHWDGRTEVEGQRDDVFMHELYDPLGPASFRFLQEPVMQLTLRGAAMASHRPLMEGKEGRASQKERIRILCARLSSLNKRTYIVPTSSRNSDCND